MTTVITPTGEVTSDHDTLHSWLCANSWQCMWQDKAPSNSSVKYFSLYSCRATGATIITQQYKERRDGWNYFIATDKHAIGDCLNELTALATKKTEAA